MYFRCAYPSKESGTAASRAVEKGISLQKLNAIWIPCCFRELFLNLVPFISSWTPYCWWIMYVSIRARLYSGIPWSHLKVHVNQIYRLNLVQNQIIINSLWSASFYCFVHFLKNKELEPNHFLHCSFMLMSMLYAGHLRSIKKVSWS